MHQFETLYSIFEWLRGILTSKLPRHLFRIGLQRTALPQGHWSSLRRWSIHLWDHTLTLYQIHFVQLILSIWSLKLILSVRFILFHRYTLVSSLSCFHARILRPRLPLLSLLCMELIRKLLCRILISARHSRIHSFYKCRQRCLELIGRKVFHPRIMRPMGYLCP